MTDKPGVCIGCGGALITDVRARHATIDPTGVGKRCVFCSRIDTENQTIGEVYNQLRILLQDVAPDCDSFSCVVDWMLSTPEHARPAIVREQPAVWLLTKDSPFPQPRWIACYAVTGTSEGWYVHVDCIVLHEGTRVAIPIFQAKTFSGMDAAMRIAATCAKQLSA